MSAKAQALRINSAFITTDSDWQPRFKSIHHGQSLYHERHLLVCT